MTLVLVGVWTLFFGGKRPSKIEVETSGFQEHIWKNMGATWRFVLGLGMRPLQNQQKNSMGFTFGESSVETWKNFIMVSRVTPRNFQPRNPEFCKV